MENGEYINQQKDLYKVILDFFEKESDSNDDDLEQVITFLTNKKIIDNHDELQLFLQLIFKFLKNYHRNNSFFIKIQQILLKFAAKINYYFSNIELYNLFKNNKRILLFLIENNIIIIDKTIANYLFKKCDINGTKYCQFFLPEIKNF